LQRVEESDSKEKSIDLLLRQWRPGALLLQHAELFANDESCPLTQQEIHNDQIRTAKPQAPVPAGSRKANSPGFD